MMESMGSGCSSSSAIEYTVRVPKNTTKRYSIMAFNQGDKVNCSTWTRARMERDMSARRMYGEEDSSEGGAAAAAGAAGEFGRKHWPESRRKRYGAVPREFKVEDQPWLLKVNGKAGKKFKGQKKSGVTENTCYYIFTQQGPDGAFEAFPLHGWYNFAPLPKHRTLTAEEAEEEWGRRNKVVNHFNIMLQRRLREKGCGDEEEEDEKANKKKKDSGDYLDFHGHGNLEPDYGDSDSDSGMGEEGKSRVKKMKKMGKGKASKKSKGSGTEAIEDSDDGDYEGMEVDYMSDRSSSDDEPEKGKPDKGEDLPRGIDESSESDEESDEEQNEEEGKEEEEEEGEEEGKKSPFHGEEKDGNGGLDSSDDSDIEGWAASALFLVKKLKPLKRKGSTLTASRPGTPSVDSAITAGILEQGQLQGDTPVTAKKTKKEPNCQSPAAFAKGTPQLGKSTPGSSDTQLTEDAVRRYLIRKPMSTKDLLKKFQTKRTGLSSEQTVNLLAQILKRLNPERKNVNDKMLLYLKE